jgi:hypothetical protein
MRGRRHKEIAAAIGAYNEANLREPVPRSAAAHRNVSYRGCVPARPGGDQALDAGAPGRSRAAVTAPGGRSAWTPTGCTCRRSEAAMRPDREDRPPHARGCLAAGRVWRPGGVFHGTSTVSRVPQHG